MAKWTEIDTKVVEAGQEIPLDAKKTEVEGRKNMGTNFYWKAIPRELKKYRANVEKYIGAVDDNPDNVLLHIGKRSVAGLYCHNCGTTLNKHGTNYVHDWEHTNWYKQCPICGREGVSVISFCWTIMKHKWIVERLYNENCKEKLIVDEYGNEYTPTEFRDEVRTPIEFQSCCEFC